MSNSDKSNQVITRFAPSPTGDLHLGGARTALFNYLFAKNQNGKFLIRIEDTDKERSTPEAVETIISGLKWLGINSKDEPIFQSKRNDIYHEYALKLLKEGHAYPCFCSQEELTQMRELAQSKGEKPVYNRTHRNNTGDSLPTGNEEKPFVIRIKAPLEGETIFQDKVLGEIKTPNSELDDFIIYRSNGTPTYNFTVVVDDLEMSVSHVIRGVDHVSNTPKQILIYDAIKKEPPIFVHVPMILGEDKKKLSKRHGATSVFEYKKDGYLSEAFNNFLARLSWSSGDKEIFSNDELIELFNLESISKSDAVADFEKLRWVNSEHLKSTSDEKLAELLNESLSFNKDSGEYKKLSNFIPLQKERAKTLNEIIDASSFLFEKPTIELNKKMRKAFNPDNKELYLDFITEFEKYLGKDDNPEDNSFEDFISDLLSKTLEKHEAGFGKLAQPLRVALTGSAAGLEVPKLAILLGKKESSDRFKIALEFFKH